MNAVRNKGEKKTRNVSSTGGNQGGRDKTGRPQKEDKNSLCTTQGRKKPNGDLATEIHKK